MDGRDRDELTMADQSHDPRTKLDISSTETRSDYMKSRSLRPVLGLGLLCVLLLLVVVTLQCVMLTKGESSSKSKWIPYGRSSYLISSEWKNWADSRHDCLQKGADLIIINDQEEQDFITFITSANVIWIGLTDRDKEGSWKWVDDSPLSYSTWRPGEPNSFAGDEDCAATLVGWGDYPCISTFVSVCERKLEV